MQTRRLGLISALLGLVLWQGGAYAQTAGQPLDLDSPRVVHIPTQSLESALVELSKQASFQLIISAGSLPERTTASIDGPVSLREALAILLRGTGLKFTAAGENTVAIRKKDEKLLSASPQKDLGEDGGSGLQGSHMAQTDQGSTAATASQGLGNPNNAAEASQYASTETLEEVVVTAQKRQERLIDTPQSVTVISSSDLARVGAVQLSDIASSVPGLTFTTSGVGESQISLRGVTSFTPNGTVGIYIDDVPYGSSSEFAAGGTLALDAAMFDLNRIEVLRGPQGTLYGASTMGGLLKYVTNAPDPTAFGGSAQIGTSAIDGGAESYRASATVNVPIVGSMIAVRASGFESHDGGYIDDIGVGQKDADRSDVYGGRLDTLIVPTEALSIRLTGFLQNISRDGNSLADYSLNAVPLYGSLDQKRELEEPFNQEFRLGSITVGYNLGPSSLTSITSYQSVESTERPDFSYLAPSLNPPGENLYDAAGIVVVDNTDKFTQEIRFGSNSSRPFEYLIGAFYTHETSTQTQNLVAQNTAGLFVQNFYTLDVPSTYQEEAIFADLTYHLTTKFDISGGIRQAHDRQTYSEVQTGIFGAANVNSESDENVRTYLANARYHFSNDATGYIRYATGYRPGGPNFAVAGGPPTFGPDSLKSYEAGVKAEAAGGRLGIDVAGYYIDWNNIQITTFLNGLGFIENAPNAHVQGSELSVTARPTRDLTLSGAFAYQHAYLSEASPALGAALGESVPNVPRFSGSFSADYTFLEQQWHPTVGATFKRTSSRDTGFGETGTSANYFLPGYSTLDLRSGVVLGSVNLQFYAHNVCNKRGQISGGGEGTYEQVAIIQPRTVGIAANLRF